MVRHALSTELAYGDGTGLAYGATVLRSELAYGATQYRVDRPELIATGTSAVLNTNTQVLVFSLSPRAQYSPRGVLHKDTLDLGAPSV
eukprot:363153-Rhodomonas_salina.1